MGTVRLALVGRFIFVRMNRDRLYFCLAFGLSVDRRRLAIYVILALGRFRWRLLSSDEELLPSLCRLGEGAALR